MCVYVNDAAYPNRLSQLDISAAVSNWPLNDCIMIVEPICSFGKSTSERVGAGAGKS